MKDFLNSDLGIWVLRMLMVLFASAVKAGYIPIPLETLGAINTSDILLGSAALIPSKQHRPSLTLKD
jgi:hypothetical protein